MAKKKTPEPAAAAPQIQETDPGLEAGTVTERILRYLADGQVRRYIEIADALGAPSIGGDLRRLEETGAVVKISRGIYAKSGSDVEPAVLPVRKLGSASKRVFDLLEQPKSAAELKAVLGVSAQAVDQHLKALMDRGLVARTKTFGERGGYVYLHATDELPDAVAGRPPLLSGTVGEILSAVPTDAPTMLADLVGSGPAAPERRRLVRTLESLGLIKIDGAQHLQLVTLTESGREHPAYDPNAPKARALREPPDEHAPGLQLLIALYALGRANARDLMLATGVGRGRGDADIGTFIQELEAAGLLEVAAPEREEDPPYRLTAYGLAHLAPLRGKVTFPDSTELSKHLALERANDPEAQEARARESKRGDRLTLIVELLREKGPMTTAAINPLLPRPYADRTSLTLALNGLVKRGLVKRLELQGRGALVWAAADGQTGKTG